LVFRVNTRMSRVLKKKCLEITGYRTKYSTALWLLELQIMCCRKVLDAGTDCK